MIKMNQLWQISVLKAPNVLEVNSVNIDDKTTRLEQRSQLKTNGYRERKLRQDVLRTKNANSYNTMQLELYKMQESIQEYKNVQNELSHKASSELAVGNSRDSWDTSCLNVHDYETTPSIAFDSHTTT